MGFIQLLVIVVVLGLVLYLVQIMPLAQPFKNIALVVVVLIFILVLLSMVGLLPSWPVNTVR